MKHELILHLICSSKIKLLLPFPVSKISNFTVKLCRLKIKIQALYASYFDMKIQFNYRNLLQKGHFSTTPLNIEVFFFTILQPLKELVAYGWTPPTYGHPKEDCDPQFN